MAVTITQDTIRMDTAGDEFTDPIVPQSIRFVAESGQLASDEIVLVDPVTLGELWRTYGGSATTVESELLSSGEGHRTWINGFRLGTLTGNRGIIYLRFM